MEQYSCDFCNFACRIVESDLMFKHLARFHSNEPNFVLYCASCPRSFKSVNSLQKHYYREHKPVEEHGENGCDGEGNDNAYNLNNECNDEVDRHNFQHHVAKFLLGAKEKAKLTQTALDMVKDSTKNLLTEYLDIVKKKLSAKLTDSIGEEFQFTRDMDELFAAESVFDGLNSEHEQTSYYLQNFNLVEPVEVEMGRRWHYVFSEGRQILKQSSVFGYQVPFLQNLEALLQNQDVVHEIDNPHFSNDGALQDVMDGEFYKTHPVFSLHNNAIQLLGYYDDLEIANPLGSKSKIHKIGVFYYVLGNIRPKFRSSIRNIQLICIAKTKDIKEYGIDNLLSPFIEEVNKLSEDGYYFNICGQQRHLLGGLLLWTGDTLGSNYVGGYKEGVGGAHRICRHCMATRDQSCCKFLADEFQQRVRDNHLRECSLVEDPDNAPDVRDRLSATYGVNRRSILDDVKHFDICKCFPEDVMHVLLEGLVPYETKLLLKVLIDENRSLTLKELNQRLHSFDYGYMNRKNKPSPITRETINGLGDKKLKQSASQMWCLLRFLPIIIGDRVDENCQNWACFQKLWNIVQICMSPTIKIDDVAYLRLLIQEHHLMFKELYPTASIIPKMHFLIHVPDHIIRFGPPRNVWTMRFEAKHTFFKGSVSKNFRNIPKSMAFRHQRNMCWNLLQSPAQNSGYLYSGDLVGSGDHNIDLGQHPHFQLLCDAAGLEELPENFVGSRVKHVEIHGVQYRPGAALRLEDMDDFGERDYPVYGKIDEILVWEDAKFFVVTLLTTVELSSQLMAYKVTSTNQTRVISYSSLSYTGVMNMVLKNGCYFIVEKECASVEDV